MIKRLFRYLCGDWWRVEPTPLHLGGGWGVYHPWRTHVWNQHLTRAEAMAAVYRLNHDPI